MEMDKPPLSHLLAAGAGNNQAQGRQVQERGAVAVATKETISQGHLGGVL